VVTLICDSGAKYLSKMYNDFWMVDQGMLQRERTGDLRDLIARGFHLFLVTNQSGIGRGYFTLADVDRVHAHIEAELAAEDVVFDGIYVAPEAPDQPSRGRKPSPAFLHDAAQDFDIDLSRSYVVGDKVIDLQTGWNAGCARSLLVRTGEGALAESTARPGELRDAVVVDDLAAACRWILSQPEP
jgi:D-glycero-D-manno-heptose 1,7-bisphosphate phosphatase